MKCFTFLHISPKLWYTLTAGLLDIYWRWPTGHWCRRYCICLLMALVNLVKSSHV